ncbi:MAG: CHRD domain-containing protein [Gemmatimonadaceae bacterium]
MRFPVSIFCTSLLLAACSGGYERVAAPPPPSAQVTVIAASSGVLTSVGDTRALTARVLAADGQVIASPQVSWRSSAPAVATVSGTGTDATVTAVGNGTALITAMTGDAEYTIGVTVRQVIGSVAIQRPAAVVEPGETMQLTAVALDARFHEIPFITGFTFSTHDTRVVLVTPDGVVTGLASLSDDVEATITAEVTRDGVTALGLTKVRVAPVEPFTFKALMASNNITPDPVFTDGVGVGYLSVGNGIASYVIAWNALSGPATAVHIHGPANAFSGAGILVDLPLPAQSETHGAFRESFTAGDIRSLAGAPPISMDSLVVLIINGSAYLDVHTAAHPAGEIRGQLFWPNF